MKKKSLNFLIYALAVVLLFQAVSICVLIVKNAKLKRDIARKHAVNAALHKKPAAVVLPVAKGGCKLSIVLDDWGYNKKNISALLELKQPITVAILPNLPFSKSIAVDAHKNNVEVILHLPLEAHDVSKMPEKGVINTGMSSEEALKRLQSALDSIPYLKGVSNHMGSKATEDEKLMKLLFIQFKKKNLYFLDSMVTNNSVCRKAADDTGIRFAERSVFLDNENTAEYIRGQLEQAIAIAKEKKVAVVIGHDRPLTLKAIKNMLPEFQREGVKLIYLSEAVK